MWWQVLPVDDSVVQAGQSLLARILEAREAHRLALERLVAATAQVKESYETEYLKEELRLALECPDITEDADEVSQARALIREIQRELSERLKAATEAAAFFDDIAVLDAELKYVLSVVFSKCRTTATRPLASTCAHPLLQIVSMLTVVWCGTGTAKWFYVTHPRQSWRLWSKQRPNSSI